MLGPEEAYEGLYGQGPPSVHSSHGGRAFHQQGMYVICIRDPDPQTRPPQEEESPHNHPIKKMN